MKRTKRDLDETVQRILSLPYHRVITGGPGDGYLGEVPELPGCYTAGETAEEALRNLDEAMALWLEVALMHGDSIPGPAVAVQAIA